jgi:hypothetical protein
LEFTRDTATSRPFSYQHEIRSRLSCCVYTFKEFQCRNKLRVVTIRWNDYFHLCTRSAYAGPFFGFYMRPRAKPVFCRDFFALCTDTMTDETSRSDNCRSNLELNNFSHERENQCTFKIFERMKIVTLTYVENAFINILYIYLQT